MVKSFAMKCGSMPSRMMAKRCCVLACEAAGVSAERRACRSPAPATCARWRHCLRICARLGLRATHSPPRSRRVCLRWLTRSMRPSAEQTVIDLAWRRAGRRGSWRVVWLQAVHLGLVALRVLPDCTLQSFIRGDAARVALLNLRFGRRFLLGIRFLLSSHFVHPESQRNVSAPVWTVAQRPVASSVSGTSTIKCHSVFSSGTPLTSTTWPTHEVIERMCDGHSTENATMSPARSR